MLVRRVVKNLLDHQQKRRGTLRQERRRVAEHISLRGGRTHAIMGRHPCRHRSRLTLHRSRQHRCGSCENERKPLIDSKDCLIVDMVC